MSINLMSEEHSRPYREYNSSYLVASMDTVLSMVKRLHSDLDDTINRRAAVLEAMAIEHGLDDEPEWIYEDIDAEFCVDLQAIRILYAGLAVIIASGAESVVESICRDLDLPIGDRPDWGRKKNALEGAISASFDQISSFAGNKRARLLGNCFKHSDGNVNRELAEFAGMREGDEIRYEDEDWHKLIKETEEFLTALCDQVAKLP